MVLANLIGIVLFGGGSLVAPSFPPLESPDRSPRADVCLLERSCDRPAEFCLLKEPACGDAADDAPVCLLDDCPAGALRLRKVER